MLLAVGILAAPARPAAAATFSVNPTQIFLGGRTLSALVTIRNESGEALRFQLSVFAWSQSPSGEMTLTPTEDIVFFPPLLTLRPAEERRIRVGSVAPAGSQEKTYRIFVEELPPFDGATDGGSAVRVLTKMGIPIFLRPAREAATGTLTDVGQQSGRLHFALANTGTVHFVPQAITVRGLAKGSALFERTLEGWYVLAGTRRLFELDLPRPECTRVTSLAVEVKFNAATLEEHLETPGGACAP